MKPKTREVRAFVCGACKRLRKTREQADKCCLCPCGERVSKRFWGRCEACGLRNSIRSAKGDVKRARAVLASREGRLTALINETRGRSPTADKGERDR